MHSLTTAQALVDGYLQEYQGIINKRWSWGLFGRALWAERRAIVARLGYGGAAIILFTGTIVHAPALSKGTASNTFGHTRDARVIPLMQLKRAIVTLKDLKLRGGKTTEPVWATAVEQAGQAIQTIRDTPSRHDSQRYCALMSDLARIESMLQDSVALLQASGHGFFALPDAKQLPQAIIEEYLAPEM